MLSIHDLDVVFNAGHDEVHAVKGISYEVPSGSVVGVVGESGSGKSVSAMSVMGFYLIRLVFQVVLHGMIKIYCRLQIK